MQLIKRSKRKKTKDFFTFKNKIASLTPKFTWQRNRCEMWGTRLEFPPLPSKYSLPTGQVLSWRPLVKRNALTKVTGYQLGLISQFSSELFRNATSGDFKKNVIIKVFST